MWPLSLEKLIGQKFLAGTELLVKRSPGQKGLDTIMQQYHLLKQCIHHIGRQKHGVQLEAPVGAHRLTRRILALLIAQPKQLSIS